MPSPDVAAYVGLDLLDLDAQQLIEQAIASASTKFVGWTPREGNTEVVLIEELAALVEEDVYGLNRIPDAIVERLLLLMGLTRDLGAAATGSVTFTAGDTAGYTIPAGTALRIDTTGVDDVDVTTNTALTIAAGQTTGTVAVTARPVGTANNGVPAGTRLEVLDSVSGISSAVLASGGLAGGRDPEDGDAFLARAAPRLTTLTTTLARAADVEAYVISAYPSVARVKVLDLYDANTPQVDPGGSPGNTTIAVAGLGGTAVPGATLTAIDTDVTNRVVAGLNVTVVNANVTAIDVAITVLALPGQTAATVQANVIAAIGTYLNPDTWDWGRLVRRNELIARADTAAGVDTVLSVTTPANDLTLTGAAPLAKAGTITVTVQAP